jgi:hypothetical protein
LGMRRDTVARDDDGRENERGGKCLSCLGTRRGAVVCDGDMRGGRCLSGLGTRSGAARRDEDERDEDECYASVCGGPERSDPLL